MIKRQDAGFDIRITILLCTNVCANLDFVTFYFNSNSIFIDNQCFVQYITIILTYKSNFGCMKFKDLGNNE